MGPTSAPMWTLLFLVPGAASLHIVFGGHCIPHPEKVAKGGEDAFFFDDRLGIFGIADGVGGSARGQVDPGAFSRDLLQRCHLTASTSPGRTVPKMTDALRTATEFPTSLGGSTTLLLGQLEPGTDTLQLLNLGDSGAMLLRPALREFGDSKVLFPRCVLRSQDQEHGFNWPYQANARNFDTIIDELDVIKADLKEGDVIIAATDGVLDNLFDIDMQACVSELVPILHGDDPEMAQDSIDFLAKRIAERANAVGLQPGSPALKTPFQQAALEDGRQYNGGGKLDDIAIICGVVRVGERPGQRMVHNFDGANTRVVLQSQAPTRGVVAPTHQAPADYPAAAQPQYAQAQASPRTQPQAPPQYARPQSQPAYASMPPPGQSLQQPPPQVQRQQMPPPGQSRQQPPPQAQRQQMPPPGQSLQQPPPQAQRQQMPPPGQSRQSPMPGMPAGGRPMPTNAPGGPVGGGVLDRAALEAERKWLETQLQEGYDAAFVRRLVDVESLLEQAPPQGQRQQMPPPGQSLQQPPPQAQRQQMPPPGQSLRQPPPQARQQTMPGQYTQQSPPRTRQDQQMPPRPPRQQSPTQARQQQAYEAEAGRNGQSRTRVSAEDFRYGVGSAESAAIGFRGGQFMQDEVWRAAPPGMRGRVAPTKNAMEADPPQPKRSRTFDRSINTWQ